MTALPDVSCRSDADIEICNQSIPRSHPYSPEATAAFATSMMLVMLFTIFGNILVIIAVLTCHSLRGPQNLFLVSLAAADILVATLIIPFSLAKELMGYWYFTSVWCEIILALDVLFCTSSIIHLCAISLDRYLSVSRPMQYGTQRTPRKIKGAILVVWLISAVISFPPLISMNKTQKPEGGDGGPQCELNSEPWYILYSSIGSFFAPCLIMILVYVRIYQIAKKHTRCPPGEPRKDGAGAIPQAAVQRGSPENGVNHANASSSNQPAFRTGTATCQPQLPTVENQQQMKPPRKKKRGNNNEDSSSSGSDEEVERRHDANGTTSNVGALDAGHQTSPTQTYRNVIATSKGSQLASPNIQQTPAGTPNTRKKAMIIREKRFTFVLAVVIGVFVICWFPFFFTYSLKAVCPETCKVPEPLFTFFFWIGYCNSALNPLIYTIFNRDFRKAFKKILCKSCKACFL